MENGESRGWFDANEVRDAARGRWEDVLARFDVRTDLLSGRHGPCPGCGGRDRFRFDDKDGDGTFICSQGGGELLSGDGLMLLSHVKEWEWKKCVEEVGRLLIPDRRKSNGGRPRVDLGEGVARAPHAERVSPGKIKYDPKKLEAFVANTPRIGRDWVKERSRLPVQHVRTTDFLEALFHDDERVLIFTNYYSQGDFLHRVGVDSYRLASERGVKAVRSALPTRGKNGVWFLANPVTGLWEIGDPKPILEKREVLDRNTGEKVWRKVKVGEETYYTRRAWQNATAWRYLVLESDDAPEELWIRALVKLALPVAAIYSSGGRSLHALIKVDAGSKLEWDAIRDAFKPLLCPIGADPGAVTAVRLTRLPGCLREGKTDKQGRYTRFETPQLQELIYLNPDPPMKPLLTLKAREVIV